MLALASGVLITNAIHAVPERLVFLIIEKKSGAGELCAWQNQLRLRIR
jgi:hypothetical protein